MDQLAVVFSTLKYWGQTMYVPRFICIWQVCSNLKNTNNKCCCWSSRTVLLIEQYMYTIGQEKQCWLNITVVLVEHNSAIGPVLHCYRSSTSVILVEHFSDVGSTLTSTMLVEQISDVRTDSFVGRTKIMVLLRKQRILYSKNLDFVCINKMQPND